MEKNPVKRWTIEQIKRAQFFAGIDWKAVEKREIAPTMGLRKRESEGEFAFLVSLLDNAFYR